LIFVNVHEDKKRSDCQGSLILQAFSLKFKCIV
jgi:hypothetical protein